MKCVHGMDSDDPRRPLHGKCTPMKKPRKPKKATWRDFMDGKTSRSDAARIASTANKIVDVLWPLSPEERREVLKGVQLA